MRLILPLLLALIGAASGIGAGLYLKPAPGQTAADQGPQAGTTPETATAGAEHDDAKPGEEPQAGSEFVRFSDQFIVPVLDDGQVGAMVVVSLSLAAPAGRATAILAQEPRLRDAFLQVLFDYANTGGFDGEFTNGNRMDLLRGELRRAGRKLLDDDIADVLITEIARQDVAAAHR